MQLEALGKKKPDPTWLQAPFRDLWRSIRSPWNSLFPVKLPHSEGRRCSRLSQHFNCPGDCPTLVFRWNHSELLTSLPCGDGMALGNGAVMSELSREWLRALLLLLSLIFSLRNTNPLALCWQNSSSPGLDPREPSQPKDSSPHTGGCLHCPEHIQVGRGGWDPNASHQGHFLVHQTRIPANSSMWIPKKKFCEDLSCEN